MPRPDKQNLQKETGSSAMPPNKQGILYPKGYSRSFTRADGDFKIKIKKGGGNGPKSGKKVQSTY